MNNEVIQERNEGDGVMMANNNINSVIYPSVKLYYLKSNIGEE